MQDTRVKLNIQEAGPGCLVLTCNGGLSWDDRELLAANVEQYLGAQRQITGAVMDMAAVEFVNSAGLGALFQLVDRLRLRGGRVIFARVPPTLVRLFRTVGLERITGLADDVGAALEMLTQPHPAPVEVPADCEPRVTPPQTEARGTEFEPWL